MQSKWVGKWAMLAVLSLVTLVVSACAPTASPSPTPPVGLIEFTVYFLDENKFATGEQPFEVAVTRLRPDDAHPFWSVLNAYFQGPTEEEAAQGLVALYHGFTGVRDLRIEGDTIYVYLEGQCESMGAAYNIASLLIKNLKQFPEIQYVKIFDENGETDQPTGPSNSIPFCLQP